jgi:opacity protein-like surface antigen
MRKFIIAAVLAIAALTASADARDFSRDEDWDRLVHEVASYRSAHLPNGKLAASRTCHPEFNACTNYLTFSVRGVSYQLQENVDINDKILNRFVCKVSGAEDMCECTNFDNGHKVKSVKVNGEWIAVKSWNEEAQRSMDYNPWLDNGRAWMHTFQK